MISINEIRTGIAVLLEGELYIVENFEHVKPGKGSAFVRVKLRNMKLGTILQRTFKSNEKIEDIFIEQKNLQFMYQSGDSYYFMCQETYEEIVISKQLMGKGVDYLKDHMQITALMYKGNVVGVNVPNFVILRVESTDPGMRGDTAKSGTKPAKMETGVVVQVPLFINNGDMLKIDTRTGQYVERV